MAKQVKASEVGLEVYYKGKLVGNVAEIPVGSIYVLADYFTAQYDNEVEVYIVTTTRDRIKRDNND